MGLELLQNGSHRRNLDSSSTKLTRKATWNNYTFRKMESEMSVKCFICKQKEHLARFCPEARKKPVVLEDTGPDTPDAVEQRVDEVIRGCEL